jgi:hypothetical protein
MKPSGYFDVYKGTDGSPSFIQIKPELADKTSVKLYTLPDLLAALREMPKYMIEAGVMHDNQDDLSDIGADVDGIFLAMLDAFEKEQK